jgi:hypothetical protein
MQALYEINIGWTLHQTDNSPVLPRFNNTPLKSASGSGASAIVVAPGIKSLQGSKRCREITVTTEICITTETVNAETLRYLSTL